MESNPYRNARLLLLISGVVYILEGLVLLVISMRQQINIRINGTQISANLWEMTEHPKILTLWSILIIVPFLFGIIALWYRRKQPEEMTKVLGITLIIIGIITFFTGAGVLLAVAGGQIIILHAAYAKGYRLNSDLK